MDCSKMVNDEFLQYLREFQAGGSRELSAASGYLRYLYFEMFTPHLKGYKGGDFNTLVCGLVLALRRAVELCLKEDELSCSIARDLLDVIWDIGRFLDKKELVRKAKELWVLLDPENMGEESEVRASCARVVDGLTSLLSDLVGEPI